MEKNNNPLVSVVVPLFNAEKYISQCLESLLNSTYKNLEIILIDDGSTDSSLKIISDFKSGDSRIKVIRQKNQGAGAARNVGIENSKGDYILFVDADDILFPRAISSCVSILREKDSEILMFNYLTINQDYKYCFRKDTKVSNQYDLTIWDYNKFWENYFSNNLVWCVAPWGKFYKRDVFQKVRFKQKYYEDEFILEDIIKKDTKIVVVNEAFYLYRVHSESTMARPFSTRYLDKFDCLMNRIKYFQNDNSSFVKESSLMAIHSYNILRRHINLIGRETCKNELNRLMTVLKSALKCINSKEHTKKIKKFINHSNWYFFFNYSNLTYQFRRLCRIPRKIKYRLSIKRTLKIASKYIINGKYEIKDGFLKKSHNNVFLKPNIFKVQSKEKNDITYDSGRIIKTQYKVIFITNDESFYIIKNKKRYIDAKDNYLHLNKFIKYPTMQLSFDDNNLVVIGETIKGHKYKRNEKFNAVLDYLFDFYDISSYLIKGSNIFGCDIKTPVCVQHGDLKDSNIIWTSDDSFQLIDLEAISYKPIFFDLFFYILISKKEAAITVFENENFARKVLSLADSKGLRDYDLDKLFLIYLAYLVEGFNSERTQSYYNYYLKDAFYLVSKCKNMVRCNDYLSSYYEKKGKVFL